MNITCPSSPPPPPQGQAMAGIQTTLNWTPAPIYTGTGFGGSDNHFVTYLQDTIIVSIESLKEWRNTT